jgi:type IV pilus assembly protein PilQ
VSGAGPASWLLAALLLVASLDAFAAPPGKRIDLEVHRADVRHVLRLLADVGGVNLVVGDDVSGEVTLRLRRVTWTAALDAVLFAKGLEVEWRGGIAHVARAEVFAARRQREIDRRQQCLDTAPLRTRILRPSYARAAEMAPLVRATLTPRGTVHVDERTNTLVIRDVVCLD